MASMKDLLYSKNGNYYQWRFGKIFYTKQGKGLPLLLIHELNHTSSDVEYRLLIDHLSSKHTVYTVDLLGCGRSDKPKLTYTNYLYVQLINDFIKNIIGSKTNVIASGSSSTIAIMACNTDQQLYNKLMLINPENLSLLNKIPVKRHKLLKCLLEFPLVGTVLYNIVSSKRYIRYDFYNNYFYCAYKAKSKYIDAYYESAHKSGASSKYLYSSIRTHYTSTNINHSLKNINNSIYLILGQHEQDGKQTLSQYKELNKAIEFSVLDNTKHLPQLESPKELLSLCDIFF